MRASTSLPPQGRQGSYSFPLPARLPLFCVFSPRLDAQRRQQAGGTGPGKPQPLARAGPAACCGSSATQAGTVTVPVSLAEPVTARVPGPARARGRVRGRAGKRTSESHHLRPQAFGMQRKAAPWYLYQPEQLQESSNKRFTFDVRCPFRSTAFPSRATVLHFHACGWTRSIVKRFSLRVRVSL